MAINIKFDLAGNPEPPTIILATRSGKKLGQLDVNPESIELCDKLNDASEFTFTLNKYINNEVTNLWDSVVDFKLVYCKEWDVWFEITVELDEDTETVKTVTCTQLGQAELSQIMLYDIEINTEDDIARDDYKITILWSLVDNKDSLLTRLLKDKAPHYSVVHVDSTIMDIQRSFSFNDKSIYDAFQEIAEEIGCLFVFGEQTFVCEDCGHIGVSADECSKCGSKNVKVDKGHGDIRRTISVYDLQQNCNDCGHRGEFTDECPNLDCTGDRKNIKYGYGENTLIFVTADELASSGISLMTDTDSVKNCFKLEAGDDLMTATIRNCNPNGTDYIWRFSDDMKEDMSNELVEAIESYDELYKKYYSENIIDLDTDLVTQYNELVDKYKDYNKKLQPVITPIVGYSSLMNAYYNTIDLEIFLKSSLMPNIETSETTAEEQAEMLTDSLFHSTIGVANADIFSQATADSTVLAFAKTIIRPTYKIQVKDSALKDSMWTGNFIITNYSNEEDTAISSSVSVWISGDIETFVRQKLEKILNRENTDDLSITGLFKKEILLETKKDENGSEYTVHSVDENGNCKCPFCAELKKYALNPLVSFREACQACLDILIEQDVGNNIASDLYKNLYDPYYKKLMAIESEIALREKEINIIVGIYDEDNKLIRNGLQNNIEGHRNRIQDNLNFEKYLNEKDEELWPEFCSYRREDKYSNDNYISDGLDNAKLFERALEFFDVAEKEIYKASELQHSISTNLNNLLAIPKFKSLIDSFKVGNWIRIQVDDRIYKLRLLEYKIDFDDFNNIPVEFSDVTKIKNGITDVESILSQASSIASSYDSVQRQANKGDDAQNTVSEWLENGLNSAHVRIQNNNNEEVQMTKNGLIFRTYNDITESYNPEQLKLTHNIMAYTNDNWETVKQAIGKHNYKYYNENRELVDGIGYGLSATFVTAGYINGSQIIGGEIYSDNYSIVGETKAGSYINLRDGTFNFGGGKITFNGESLEVHPDNSLGMTEEQVTKITEDTISTTNVTAENLQVDAANVSGTLKANKINASELTINAGKVEGELSAATISAGKISSGTISSDSGVNINGTCIMDNTITADQIAANTITASEIAADAIGTNELQANVRIISPTIEGGTFYATGQGRWWGYDGYNNAAYYICDGRTSNVKGYLSYDTSGNEAIGDAKERVMLNTSSNVALKLNAGGNMSLQANNKIYILSSIVLNSQNYGTTTPNYGVTGQLFFVLAP